MSRPAPFAGRPVPLIIAELDERLTKRLTNEGWQLHEGFRLSHPWFLEGVLCWGPVEDSVALASALDVAARGAGLVATRVGAAHEDVFIDDCRRLGLVPYERYLDGPDAYLPGRASGEPPWAVLLDLLLEGASIDEAARMCFMSERTAHRRLIQARRALGAASTTAAVVAWRRRRSARSHPGDDDAVTGRQRREA